MDGMNIVEGDLEYVASTLDNTGQDIADVSTSKDLAEAPEAMPGSTSASQAIPDAGQTTDKRLRALSEKYSDLSRHVTDTVQEYQANEDNLARELAEPDRYWAGGSPDGIETRSLSTDLKSRMG
ncbi:MAG: hypothetical protein Q4D79_02595 [Propionibacteriaceae bacterium]|nr:hypothetical protein [Propionibacteriaceae bacterium]